MFGVWISFILLLTVFCNTLPSELPKTDEDYNSNKISKQYTNNVTKTSLIKEINEVQIKNDTPLSQKSPSIISDRNGANCCRCRKTGRCCRCH
ncbi:hypothetical protein GWI33_020002 [Rhynchophorus ferrugineus]|uniref:Secreted protein n=1 Tax=Rhynchophorus ferrugineus TaxID=354439 RepID=A0A834M4M6_RHYFE|nr:hypothetical protein GWI33_020002 [Rhynchophorus ferrugineus]